MRVLVLTADIAPAQWSGIGSAVFHEANALRELGVAVEVLTPARLEGTRFPIEPREGDVVHLHSLSLAELALQLARRFGLPLVYTAHSLIAHELGARGEAWDARQRRLFEEAASVIFVSYAERSAALARMPSLAGRAHVVHNGVPDPPPPVDYDANGPIVFAGRFTRAKGFDLVLDMSDAMPNEFVLAGGHGDRDLHERARRSRCRLAGWLAPAELQALLASAALVVMPSRYEPFGMVALEAMRAGAPLLASTAGGLAEIVTPDSGGRTVGESTAAAWIDAAARLLDDIATCRALHARGPQHAAARFNARTAAATTLALLGSSGSSGPRCLGEEAPRDIRGTPGTRGTEEPA